MNLLNENKLFDGYQKELLHILTDKWENSKSYRGENKVAQRFFCSPDEVMPEYFSDFTDISAIKDFHGSMTELERRGLVSVEWSGTEISAVYAVKERYPDYYQILGREGLREKQDRIKMVLQSFLGKDELVDRVCKEQLMRMENGKKCSISKNIENNDKKLKEILKCILLIRGNTNELMERELSIAAAGDTKKFESSYRQTVCSLLEKYGDYTSYIDEAMDKKEMQKRILAAHNVVQNPTYIYVKGMAKIQYRNGAKLQLTNETPIALCANALSEILSVTVLSEQIMTVENLTSYNRMDRKNTFYMFLSGYHNGSKNDFLKQVYQQNPGKKWRHFGDIDPDGLYILENLKSKTGIPFEPFSMDIDTLVKYKEYGKRLEKNDKKKAESLIQNGKYEKLLNYMTEHNCKLEQEIVSWLDDGIESHHDPTYY